MRRLHNMTQAYDWGSTSDIPRFLGRTVSGEPVAEMWLGTHPLAPSQVETAEGLRPLSDIAGEVPFMLKILAAEQPLSIQVHPGQAEAREGFAREEADGVPLDSPQRVFKDPNHKPEMVYALSTFDTLVGFRPTAEILRVFAQLDTPTINAASATLRAKTGFKGIVRVLENLLIAPPPPAEIAQVVIQCKALVHDGVDIKRAYSTAAMIARHHPDDVGIVVSLLLNRFTLQPGEAMFLGTGVIHAHLSGLCLEAMANSDNVMRAGLTRKALDPEGLIRCLEAGMARVARVEPGYPSFSTEVYHPEVEEFALAVTQVSPADPDGVSIIAASHSIVMCIGGAVQLLNAQGEKMALSRGETVYTDAEDGDLTLVGTGEVAQIYLPGPGTPDSELKDLVGHRPVRAIP
ncbi:MULTISPECIES: mannose-6-phosphate isomerase, class I [unclassified Aeromicrobium]|uniref:mannose-6-phosphate isomerase, class I n=1 Tax=unclassified Aeromicrobium TaxID=2633570 RepID=UPI00396B0AB0